MTRQSEKEKEKKRKEKEYPQNLSGPVNKLTLSERKSQRA